MISASPAPTLGFLTWSSPVPTGGNVYDDRLAAALRDRGLDLRRHRAAGTWPAEADRHRAEVADVLRSPYPWLVDSIVACAVPELVVEANERGRPLTILLHSLLSTELGLTHAEQERYRALESGALAAAGRVIATSQWAADDLRRRYATTSVVVAQPGVDPSPLASGGRTAPSLLCLGSLTPTKDQITLVQALGRLADLPWTARLVGGDRVWPDYTAAVHSALTERGLQDRVLITGPLTGSALAQVWDDTDLLVLTSRSETYGMVVAEALAHAIPAIVCAGTGAVEALGETDGDHPGTTVPPGSPEDLATVVRTWLTDPELRRRWRATAERRRPTLPSWTACADIVATAVLGGAG